MDGSLRLGAKVPNSGPWPAELGVGAMAASLEAAGFASLWCSDHVAMPKQVRSAYPFSDDGAITWDVRMPWYDAVVAMSFMAAATSSAEIGCAVLVLPLRGTVLFAKQIASLDALAGGRVALGVGVGWLLEEFAAVGVPSAARGARMDEQIALLRQCWTGALTAAGWEHHDIGADAWCLPEPARTPPVLIGGMSDRALLRAARIGDGWLALQRAAELDAGALGPAVRRLRDLLRAEGRDPDQHRVVLRIIESAGQSERVAPALPALAEAGVDEVVVDTSWEDGGDATAVAQRLQDAIA